MTDEINQDDLAAEWGGLLNDDGEGGITTGDGSAKSGSGHSSIDDDMAAQWEVMVDDDDSDLSVQESQQYKKNSKRQLDQEEIDGLLGFNSDELSEYGSDGIMSIINSSLVSYERLPMLEIIFDRLVRLMTTSLRNFTSDNVEVSLESLSSVRFGDYINSIPLPAILAIFKAKEWDNYGLFTLESNLIYSVVDILLGGRSTPYSTRVEGRPYTTIETSLLKRMIEVLLLDIEQAFEPLTKVSLQVERLETNPRFTAIARPANIAFLVNMRIDMEDRGGKIEFLMPYATIEPIRELLMQGFMGEKFGNDNKWESHLAKEIRGTRVEAEAILKEQFVNLGKIMDLKVGDTLVFDSEPNNEVDLKCGEVLLGRGRIGKVKDYVAVMVDNGVCEIKNSAGEDKSEDDLGVEVIEFSMDSKNAEMELVE